MKNLDLYFPINFEALVQHGIKNGANVVGGMPWSWQINGSPVSHENDDCYIISTVNGMEHFHRKDVLIAYEDGLRIIKI